MASSDDRDKDTTPSSSSSKPENPFIRFRQNVDSHISSLLQGVIGLPSAFSNKTSENPRWAEFDEDLRRRDELKARQQKLKDSEAHRNTQAEVNIPVRKSSDWDNSSSCCGSQSYLPLGHNSVDLPLYAPIEKSLFQHLNQPAYSEAEWRLPTPSTAFVYKFINPALFSLWPDQISSDAMKMTQYMTYNMLNQSGLHQRSQSSVLPYLLFSPYSPLKLEADSRTPADPNVRNPDLIPYGQAFADLLSTQLDSPYSDVGLRTLTRHTSPLDKAYRNVRYISELDAHGLLHHWDASCRKPWTAEHPKHDTENTAKDATTEQEMYDTFLRLASLPASASENYESLFKEFEKVIDEQLDPKLRAQKDALKKEIVSEDRDVEHDLKQLDEVWKSLSKAFREEKVKEEKKKADAVPSSDRVVSTRTTTEHFKHEDGSVETTVIVERTFADGRETHTTTSHVEYSSDPESTCDSDAVRDRPGQEKEPEQDSIEKKKTEKKGWFWN